MVLLLFCFLLFLFSVVLVNNLSVVHVRLSSSVRGDFIAPPQVSELYIDLLCRYNFTGVVEFLKSNENYRVDETLKVTELSFDFINVL